MAFILVSGAYVAVAGQLFGGPPTSGVDVADALLAPTESPAKVFVPKPASSQTPTALGSIVAPQPSAPLPSPAIAAQADPLPTAPPVPRPRPSSLAVIRRAAAADTSPSAGAGYRDGTYTGTDEDAYYGRVQVQLTIVAHQIVAVKALDYPQDRRTSRYINSQALPILKREVIGAASAKIDMVSGATLTSRAYIRSLRSALAQADAGHA